MTSFNRIGIEWAGGSYRLMTKVLRTEWGFRGSIICELPYFKTIWIANRCLYAGGDINLVSVSNQKLHLSGKI